MPELLFAVFVPGEPKALKRHRTQTKAKGGRPLPFARTYDPSVKDKERLVLEIRQWAPAVPWTQALYVEFDFAMQRPKNHFRTNGELKEWAKPLQYLKAPDVSNLVKLVEDALNETFWKDDSTIVQFYAGKHYSKTPGLGMKVYEAAPVFEE